MGRTLRAKIKGLLGDTADEINKYFNAQDDGVRVLNYHSITKEEIPNERAELTTPEALFKQHMRILFEEKYNVISCAEVVNYLIKKIKIPDKTVAITFDDGFKDNYLYALSVLHEYNFKATIFIVINNLCNQNHLSISEIKDIEKSGMISFGCHTMNHKKLTALNDLVLKEEIVLAKERLENIIGQKVDLFAYPFGSFDSYNRKIVDYLISTGYLGAFTSIFGRNHFKTDPFLLRRNRMSWLVNKSEFKKHLSGAYDWYAGWQRLNF